MPGWFAHRGGSRICSARSLERRGLHNINSHVDETNYDEPPELEEGTDDEHEDFDTENEEASDDEDDHPGDADESVSADVGL